MRKVRRTKRCDRGQANGVIGTPSTEKVEKKRGTDKSRVRERPRAGGKVTIVRQERFVDNNGCPWWCASKRENRTMRTPNRKKKVKCETIHSPNPGTVPARPTTTGNGKTAFQTELKGP